MQCCPMQLVERRKMQTHLIAVGLALAVRTAAADPPAELNWDVVPKPLADAVISVPS